MRRFLRRPLAWACLVAAMTVTGCTATTGSVSERQAVFNSLTDACRAYAAALRVAAVAHASGQLGSEQVLTVDTARAVINPVCDGPAPVDPLAISIALSTIQTSLYELIVLSQSVEET
ncbi:MAG: hypothetical protein AAF563_12440 [Pseudomonadota bacterium]